jgi:hypothetical protein
MVFLHLDYPVSGYEFQDLLKHVSLDRKFAFFPAMTLLLFLQVISVFLVSFLAVGAEV